jgi:uncharacterized membrane protein YhaH (DUF805 family)
VNTLSPVGWALRPLKKYADFKGRAPRAEFWWFMLFVTLLYLVFALALGMVAGAAATIDPAAAATGAFGISFIILGLFWLALLVPTIAVQTRRLHDTNRTGWWVAGFYLFYLLYLVAVFGIAASAPEAGSATGVGGVAVAGLLAIVFFGYAILLLVFFCLPGTKGPNRYGDDPYGADVAEVFA